jgi:uncharacterized membrane protein YidH (DUF202 family)
MWNLVNTVRKFNNELGLSRLVSRQTNQDHLGGHTHRPARLCDALKLTHLTANENTFHTYMRVAMTLSAMGILIAQMSRIQHILHQDEPPRKHEFKYAILGVPQAAVCQCLAAVVIVVAAFRFFKQEAAIEEGRIWTGGWEVNLIVGAILVVSTTETP